MEHPDLPSLPARTLRSAGSFFSDMLTPTLRLGVTGLARSGKTVFVTALVYNLVSGGRLPFFAPYAEGRILRAYLEPQPDDAVPRFDYEAHLAALGRDPPDWPQSTRRISQLRVTIEYSPESWLWRQLGTQRLHIDITDYPGEWLIDLPMLDQSYTEWAAGALELAREPTRAGVAKPWLEFVRALDPLAPGDEQTALKGAGVFTRYLRQARDAEDALSTAGPGHFLMPGDLEGSPLLTFFPLPIDQAREPPRDSLAGMMSRRYESYRAHVVRPFFRDHFSRLDRQIVLVDALGAWNAGPAALRDVEASISAVLAAFRPGANTWLSSLIGRRIDRLVFAATKADHLHHTSHDRLEALLRALTDKAMERASQAGADVRVMALSALRATREAEAKPRKGETRPMPLIVGVPLPGEKLDGTVFDGRKEAAVFPGDLPIDPATALEGRGAASQEKARFVRFRPPRIAQPDAGGQAAPMPHIRLDRALDFLIGDRLA